MDSGLFHCHVDNVSRRRADGRERSAVATAAYVSGTDLWNEREQKVTSFGGRRDVFYSELIVPDGAPDWARDRAKLWNAVEASARRRDARLAKTIVVAFSRELPKSAWVKILQDYVRPYTEKGMVADAAIHDDGTGHNPHMHVLLTVAQLKPDGFGAKIADVDAKSFVTQARTGWEAIANKYLAASGAGLRLDRRSYKARGIDKTPTVHRGPNPMERRAKREHAARFRKDTSMTVPATKAERQLYPLLTQREDWPPESRTIPSGLTYAEREEFVRFWADRQDNAERAAEAQFHERKVPEWFEQKQDEATRRPFQRGRAVAAERMAPDQPDQRAEPGQQERPLSWEGVQPSLRDFERSPQDIELSRERLLYEQDVFRRAVNMGRTRQENELLRVAERNSPEMRKRIEDELFERRLRRVRESDDHRRLAALEKRMGPELRDHFDAYLSEEPDRDRFPVPGPNYESVSPSELARAQDELVREYEREEERDRER